MQRRNTGILRFAQNDLINVVLLGAALSLSAGAALGQAATPVDSIAALRAGFLNPPMSARPMVRWWWFGTAVEKPEILRELQQMKADGIGGAELAFVYPEVLNDPAKGLINYPFLSPEMLDAVNYAQGEGRKLGLRIDVTLCSGWPYGGPATTLMEAAGRLRVVETGVPAGVGTVAVPKLAEGESFVSAEMVNGTPTPPRRGRGADLSAPASTWDASTAKPLKLAEGTVSFPPENGSRVVLFFVAGHTGQQVKRAAVGAEGFVLDPFSHEAVATHLKAVGEPLVKAFGSTPPYAIFSDSLEAYGADWTPKLPAEFQKRRGYDLIPHLAELVGGGSVAADTVRHDYGVTLTELVNENYLVQIDDWAKAHGTKFRSQTYGEPAVDFSSQRLVGLAEGEGPQWRAFSTLRWATSANHVYGNPVTSGETFTWLHSPVFRAIPLDMKAEADIDFIMGENQLIFHGWPYSPPAGKVPEPGWSLYAAASFNDHNPWHPVMPAVTDYIARISWLLRQGKPANQVAVLLPTDDAWASFTPAHVTVTGALQKMITPELMSAILSAGYNVDYIDAEAIARVGFGDHQVLVVPPTDRIPVATLRKIDAWVAKGGKVIGVGRLPSLDPEGKAIANVGELTKVMALVAGTGELGKALRDAVAPDLMLSAADEQTRNAIGFIRRRVGKKDVYVVVNTSNVAVKATAKFGTATTKFFTDGEKWDPEVDKEPESHTEVLPANVELDLAPYESAVYVFEASSTSVHPSKTQERKNAAILSKTEFVSVPSTPLPVIDLSKEWKVDFTGLSKSVSEATLIDWTSDTSTLHYSGEAIYSRDVTIPKWTDTEPIYLEVEGGTALPGSPNSPPEHPVLGANGLPNPLVTRPGPGMHAYYDPPIEAAALVVINGKAAGALWHPPYRLDVSKELKPGVNHIEIHVYNTALNAWSALPPHDYKPLIEKYGDRFQMQDLDKVKPIRSGILGQIKLVQGVE